MDHLLHTKAINYTCYTCCLVSTEFFSGTTCRAKLLLI